jgi:hypothetical protein
LEQVWGKSTRAKILAPARAGSEELSPNGRTDCNIHIYHHFVFIFVSEISSEITASGGAAKKQ